MPQQNNSLSHLQKPFDPKTGKKVAPIALPADLTTEAVQYLSTKSFPSSPQRALVRAYLKSWVDARSANASLEEAHIQGRAGVKRYYDLSNAKYLVRTMKQAGYKFNK